MKRNYLLNTLLLSLILILGQSCGSSKSAKDTSSAPRGGFTLEDEIKQKLSEYEASGWQVHGTARTMKGKLYEHYDKLASNPNLTELIGVVTNVRSVNTARLAAQNSASSQYATKASSYVKGRMMSDARLNQAAGDESDMFYAAFSNKIEALLTGHLQESFSAIQRLPNGVNNYETYFLIDEEAAKKVRNQAMKAALEDTKLSIEYGQKIQKYIDETPE